MNMYKSMRIGAMHNVRYNEEAVHTKNVATISKKKLFPTILYNPLRQGKVGQHVF